MLEVAGSGKEHGDTGGFSCRDHFVVSDGSSRLYDRGDAGGNRCFNPIREWEEGIASEDAAPGSIAGTLDGDVYALDPVGLAAPDTGDRRFLRQHDGIRFDVAGGFPGEDKVPELGVG